MLKSKLLFVLPLAVSALMTTPVHAENSTVQIPVTVEGTDKATVTIASENEKAMNAVLGDKTVTIGKNGAFTISYNEPADFEYTVTQTAGDEKNAKGEKIIYDTTEYIAHVFIEAKEDGSLDPHVIVWKEANDSKSASVNFKNTTGADTSDKASVGYQVAALVTAVGLGLMLIAFRYREKHPRYGRK